MTIPPPTQAYAEAAVPRWEATVAYAKVAVSGTEALIGVLHQRRLGIEEYKLILTGIKLNIYFSRFKLLLLSRIIQADMIFDGSTYLW